MEMSNSLIAGAASKVINNKLGTLIQGATVNQTARFIRDDLEANALYLNNGSESMLLVSCDLAGLLPEFISSARKAISRATGIKERNIIIACTHTHSGPSLLPTCYNKSLDYEYMEMLHQWLIELAKGAYKSACTSKIGLGSGKAQIGYNRRLCWSDGTHTMHGDAKRQDFTGAEGPDDPQHLAIFIRNANGDLTCVVHNNTGHPASFYGRDFYSADFPGTARKYLREVLGQIPILFFNGAFGDINIDNLQSLNPYKESSEQKVSRTAHLLTGETLRLLHQAEFRDDIVIRHSYKDIHIPVCLPDKEKLHQAEDTLKCVDNGQNVNAWDILFAHGTKLLHDQFGEKSLDIIPLHAIRIGEMAIATQPCELYCQFGIDIKRRSPAKYTGIFGLADGYNGYCPTMYGIIGGGYSGEPIWWTRLSPEGGYLIVDTLSDLIRNLWKGQL